MINLVQDPKTFFEHHVHDNMMLSYYNLRCFCYTIDGRCQKCHDILVTAAIVPLLLKVKMKKMRKKDFDWKSFLTFEKEVSDTLHESYYFCY